MAGVALGGVMLTTGVWNLSYVDAGPGARALGAHYRGWSFTQAARGLFNTSVGLDHDVIYGLEPGVTLFRLHSEGFTAGDLAPGHAWTATLGPGRSHLVDRRIEKQGQTPVLTGSHPGRTAEHHDPRQLLAQSVKNRRLAPTADDGDVFVSTKTQLGRQLTQW